MRSFLGKIYKYPSQAQNPSSSESSPEPSQPRPPQIDYYNLQSLQQKIPQLSLLNDAFESGNTKIVTTFEQVMSTLHGLLNVVSELKEQLARNEEKLAEYDRLKAMVGKHSEIVRELEKRAQEGLNRVYEERNRMKGEYEDRIASLERKLIENEEVSTRLQAQLEQKTTENARLSLQLASNTAQIEALTVKLEQKTQTIAQMSAIEDTTIKFDASNKIYSIQHIDFSRIFITSKMRRSLFNFLQPKDFCNVALVNRQMHFICSRALKKQYLGILFKHKNDYIANLKKDKEQYERTFDNFPSENIRTNAIKYLFFKIKPGAYMLPYFQQEEHVQKIEEKSKLSQLSSFFRKKGEVEAVKQRHLNFQALKNDSDFKEVQKRVEVFFDKLFGVEASQDLKVFNQLMKKQLHELKNELKGNEKSLQLLCMSRYLYLEINQLNNLLQVCFALLLNKHNDLKDVKKKNDDLVQNDKVLRNLVENIANDREEVEKRIFFLENQALKNRNFEQKLEQELRITRESLASLKSEHEALSKTFNELKQQNQKRTAEAKEWSEQWQQALTLIKQIPLNSSLSE